MKAIDILLESPFGPDVQRDSGLIVPKSVQDQIDAETAKVREREAAIKAQEQEAAEKRARREAKAKEYFRQQADTDANRAREQAEAEKNARRAKREKKQFALLRKQAQDSRKYSPLTVLYGDELESTMSKEDFRKWLSANRKHYKQYVKPFETVKRFQGLIRFFSFLGISWMQFAEIWEEYNAVKQLYHENPPQITKEKHDYMMEVLDYKMIKIAIPYAAAMGSKTILAVIRAAARKGRAAGRIVINFLRQFLKLQTAVVAASAPAGVTQVGWIPIIIETIVLFGIEWLITSDWVEPDIERYLNALIAQYLLGYSEEDIARIENSLIAQVEEEKRQMLAAEVGNGQSEKSDQERFLELMKKADPSFQLN
jgi:hypothetical protein